RENAAEILLAANRASALTNQLLAFSRNQVIQPTTIDLNEQVAAMDQMLRRVIGEDIELVTSMAPNLELVKADPGQMQQVILNLVVNARDAMPKGGKLLIETANVVIGDEYARHHVNFQPGNYAMIAVSDTGCGMDEQTQSQMFEPFFTTKEKGKGTGLGLSTVYGIVRQSGGHIWHHSFLGVGTIFKVYLPASDSLDRVPARDIPKGGKGTETILLVEDEAGVRRLVREMLKRLGYTILEAADGAAAQRLFHEYKDPIHLLLTDVVMPDLGGKQLARHLTAQHQALKVLFMSGYAGEAVQQQNVLDEGMAFIQKPFTPDSLANKVRELLDG
ncbi:MAG: ATP-binding protein, partial [Bryobacteraceae bacterium]